MATVEWTQEQVDEYKKRTGRSVNIMGKSGYVIVDTPPQQPAVKPKCKLTKTEIEYEKIYLKNFDHKFEGMTLKMENGHRYTPDYFVYQKPTINNNMESWIELHEVKGSYKLGSYHRAKLAFDQAAVEYPMFKFVWAEKRKDGTWKITRR